MRQIRESLRLHLQAKLSYNEVGRTLKISKSVVGKYMSLARVAGVDWSVAQTLSDQELESRLYRPALARNSKQQLPDFAHVHQELKRAGVTLQLLWEEYAKDNDMAFKYTSFCVKYREWAMGLKRSMRQTHIAGEKLFVDYAGQTVPLIDAVTGEITKAQIFVATFGASNYTFAYATPRQTTADWIGAQVLALEFFGGVPRLIVPDQTRSLIKNPCSYDPQNNRLYEEFAAHYGCALLAARPAHPRDKPKVENAVLVVERWILARLRNRKFFSLMELNHAIALLLNDLNARAFKKLPGCRRSAFEQLDLPALAPLPANRFELFRWKSAKVNIDYHVEFDGHYYSVPHTLVRTTVELRVSDTLLECYSSNQRVACHAVSHQRGQHTTTPEHMPASHRAHLEWTPQKLIDWGLHIGVSTAAVVTWQLEHRAHPEQGYRACLSADLGGRVEQYLEERRRLGFELRCQAYCLRGLACYVRNIADYESLTLDVMAEWAQQTNLSRVDSRTWARRLKILRPFTRWMQQFEPRTEVPDYTIFGRPSERLAPHIYTEPEIIDLLAAARRLGPESGLNGRVFEMLFGLIACTGMRVSEAIGLHNSDVDLQRGMLTIRRTKFAKSRNVAIHLSAVSALGKYRWIRDLAGATQDEEAPFFPDTRLRCHGEPLDQRHVERVFEGLRKELAWVNRGTHHAPRIHDLRHTFVVRRILLWQQQGIDVDQAMLALSTYVGHAKVSNTYWYLQAVPELMAIAAQRFEDYMPEVCDV